MTLGRQVWQVLERDRKNGKGIKESFLNVESQNRAESISVKASLIEYADIKKNMRNTVVGMKEELGHVID
jgi:hypothetical protein